MAENSKIEWTDHTFNPWIGCQKVSEGCKFCYAETLTKNRMGKDAWGPKGKRFMTKTWDSPRKWNAAAEKAGVPAKVFCCSMADVFEDWHGPVHDNGANGSRLKNIGGAVYAPGFTRDLYPDAPWLTMQDMRDWLWPMVEETPWLRWLFLTKRPENVMRMTPLHWNKTFPDNVWIGTSVEDQKTADERIPHLLRIPAAVRFLSCEPLLGSVNLSRRSFQMSEHEHVSNKVCPLTGLGNLMRYPAGMAELSQVGRVHWVICGGESGPKARPMHPDWARSLRDQCEKAGVPFLFKQWGEWCPALTDLPEVSCRVITSDDGQRMFRYGKKRAGRILDGREWNGFPVGGGE